MPEPTLTQEVTAERATMFRLGAFGYQKTEVRKLRTGRAAQWAQYRNVPYASFVPKGKRKRRGFYEGYDPKTVFLPGWGLDLSIESPLTAPVKDGMFVTSVSRFGSFDPRYAAEFTERLDAWLAKNDVTPLADYRTPQKETTDA